MTSPALGLLFGLINTTALHVAKGMQLHGINTLRWRKLPRAERSGKHATIYILGVVLNQSTPVWLILANRFAAPAYATGMYGVGLVLLLIYSSVVLKEPVAPVNYAGAAAVIAGTVLFSVYSLSVGELDVAAIDRPRVAAFVVIYLVVTLTLAVMSTHTGNARLLALGFALFTGGAASMDPVLKAIGQTASGVARIFPQAMGWLPFLLSFGVGITAFLTVQWAFLRGARASMFVPVHSTVYILVPVVVQLLFLPGYVISTLLIAGIACIVAGIILMQIPGNPRTKTEP